MILFFDDDRIGLSVRKALLETTGAVVLAVDNGEDGLKLFADGGVGVVVLNFTVPRIDGGELVVRFFSPLRLLARDLAAPEKCPPGWDSSRKSRLYLQLDSHRWQLPHCLGRIDVNETQPYNQGHSLRFNTSLFETSQQQKLDEDQTMIGRLAALIPSFSKARQNAWAHIN